MLLISSSVSADFGKPMKLSSNKTQAQADPAIRIFKDLKQVQLIILLYNCRILQTDYVTCFTARRRFSRYKNICIN
jgi:hypothetical protein